MTEKLQIAKAFLNHIFKAKQPKSGLNPYILKLYKEVIASKKCFYVFEEIETLRENLESNHKKIEVKDLGAGSRVNKSNYRKISSIAKFASSSAKTGQMLFKLIDFLQPQNVLELGTSLGINTLYLASASKNAQIYTIEGCPNTISIAKEHFKKLNTKNIKAIEGDIDVRLNPLLDKLSQLDVVFFDANHRKKPTLDYFLKCLPLAKNNSVFIFDDIYWSQEMTEAWREIIKHPKVTFSIDLFDLGLIFFNKEFDKEHLTLKF